MYPGIYTTFELNEKGLSDYRIHKFVAEGKLQRLARGWYADATADSRLVTAVRSRARLGCLTACAYHGLWVPPLRDEIHVVIGAGENLSDATSRLRKATGGLKQLVIHREPGIKGELVCTVEEAVEQVARYHDAETALIVLESALNLRFINEAWAKRMLARIPKRRAQRLANFQLGSQSGSETRVAHFLRARGLRVRQQVPLFPDPYQRVDMLVGESWVIECDSARHHSSVRAYESDRRRDFYLESLGYHVTRLTYSHVWAHWEETTLALVSIINRRDYRKPPVSRG